MEKNTNARSMGAKGKMETSISSAAVERLHNQTTQAYECWTRHGDGKAFVQIYQAAINGMIGSLSRRGCAVPMNYTDRLLGGSTEVRVKLFQEWTVPEILIGQATVEAMRAMHNAWLNTVAAEHYRNCELEQYHCFLPFEFIGWDLAKEYYKLLSPIMEDLNQICSISLAKQNYSKVVAQTIDAGATCEEALAERFQKEWFYYRIPDEEIQTALAAPEAVQHNVGFAVKLFTPYWEEKKRYLKRKNAEIARRVEKRGMYDSLYGLYSGEYYIRASMRAAMMENAI